MKNTTTIIILGAALLVAGSPAANAQRQRNAAGYDPTAGGAYQRGGGFGATGGFQRNTRGIGTYGPDPRVATNIGFEIISINNIFNPNRIYTPPNTNSPPIPTYSFTLAGVMTYGANDVGYGFFTGNAVTPTRGYMASDTINGYKIAEITNNTVKLVDTNNNQEYTLRVGAGFSRRGTTNQWLFRSVPEPALSASGSSSMGSDSGSSGPVSDTMRRLMERRQKEEAASGGGDAAAAASPDAGSPPAPADGAPPPASPDNPPPAGPAANSPNNSNPTPAPAN